MHTRAVLLVHSVTRNAIRKTTLIGTQEQNTGSTVSSVEWNARTKRTWGTTFWRTTTTDSPPTSQLASRLPAQSAERRTETGSPWFATFVGRTISLNLSPGWARTSWNLGEFRRPWQAGRGARGQVQAQADHHRRAAGVVQQRQAGAVQRVVVEELH